jgi:RNA polymerase sigma factor (sigma-70 family)
LSPRTPSRSAAAGDLRERLLYKAFAQEKKLRVLLHRFTRNHADTEELMQEVYVRLLRMTTQTLPEIDCIGALITTTAYNLGCDFFRRQRLVAMHMVAAVDADLYGEDEPENWLMIERELDQLAHIVESMPPRRAQVYTLRKVFGLSQKEIARDLGISVNTVEQHVTRASRYIAQTLHERIDPPMELPLPKTLGRRAATLIETPATALANSNTPGTDTATTVECTHPKRELTE